MEPLPPIIIDRCVNTAPHIIECLKRGITVSDCEASTENMPEVEWIRIKKKNMIPECQTQTRNQMEITNDNSQL